MEALHSAFLHHLQFGREIVYTYGPWGFLFGGYRPETHLLSSLIWLGLGIIFWVAGRRLAYASFPNEFARWLWLMAVTALTTIAAFPNTDARLICFPLFLIGLHFFDESKSGKFIQTVLIVSLGLLSLVKFTLLIIGIVVIATMAADTIWRRRRFPWSTVWYGGSVLLFWLLAGQHLSSFAPYITNSFQITSGYTEAMSAYHVGESGFIVWFALVAMMSLGTTTLALRRSLHWFGLLPLCALAFIIFVLFKHGFVRDDVHQAAAAVLLLIVVLTCFAMLWLPAGSNRWLRGLGSFSVAAACLLAAFSFQRFGEPPLTRQIAESVRPEKWLAPVQLLYNGAEWREARERYLSDYRESYAMPPLKGDVDFYSWNLMPGFAYGLRYQPRPVFQSFSAYTPQLARLNAEHLRGDKTAETIVFDGTTIDRRYAALDDALSWPELLTRYDVQEVEIPFVVLKRSTAPREFKLTLLQEASIKFGEQFLLPTNAGPIWAEIEINYTMSGSFVSKLFKPSLLALNTTLRNGQQHSSRFIPEMAKSGFILSPYVTDSGSFVDLASEHPGPASADHDLVSFNIVPMSDSASTDFRSPFRIRLFRLDYPRQNVENVAGYQQVEQLKQDLHRADIDGPGQMLYLAGAGSVLATTATIALDRPQGSTHLRIGYGIDLRGNHQNTGGITFGAFALDAQQKAIPLWTRHIDPRAPGDQGNQETIVELGNLASSRILLNTVSDPGQTNESFHPYWSQLHFE